MFICSFLLVGCATSPQDDPAYVSPMQYDNYDCSQLKAEMRRVSTRLEQITRSEAANQALDAAVTVFAIASGYGVDTSDKDIESRRLRNQYHLLEQIMIERKCNIK